MNWNSPAAVSTLPLASSVLDPEEIRRLYWEEELSCPAIAGILGVSQHAIYHIMYRNNIPRRSNAEARALAGRVGRWKPVRKIKDPEEVRRLYWEAELTQGGIAERLGVNRKTIREIMVKYKIPRRSGCAQPKGPQSSLWKGGRYKDTFGYVHVRIYPDNPYYSMAYSDGFILEHRLVMAQHLGRPLEPWELVHHRPPGIKDNNRIENLQLTTSKRHHKEDISSILQLQEQVKELQIRVTALEAENILLRNQEVSKYGMEISHEIRSNI